MFECFKDYIGKLEQLARIEEGTAESGSGLGRGAPSEEHLHRR